MAHKLETMGSEIDKPDLQERADGMAKEFQAMLGKYEFFIGAVPTLTLDGRIEAKPIFISSRKPLPEDGNTAPEEAKPEEEATELSE